MTRENAVETADQNQKADFAFFCRRVEMIVASRLFAHESREFAGGSLHSSSLQTENFDIF